MYEIEYKLAPSAYGFRSIRPRTRGERYNTNDKVALEKHRINQRVGINARIQRANAPDSSADLTSCSTDGAGYISNSDRFHSDTCGDELSKRNHEIRTRNRAIEFRKNKQEEREDLRWKKEDEGKLKEAEYWNKIQQSGNGCPKNQSACGYDITSLAYHNDLKGECAKYDDDMVRYRSNVRTVQLVTNGDTRAPYNIISGTQRQKLEYPEVIVPPQDYHMRLSKNRK